MTTRKLLNQRTLKCLARDDFWLPTTTTTTTTSTGSAQQQQQQQRNFVSLAVRVVQHNKQSKTSSSSSFKQHIQEHFKQPHRLTSTTPPTANISSIPGNASASSVSQVVVTTSSGGPQSTGSVPKRDASTQAKHQVVPDLHYLEQQQQQQQLHEQPFRAGDLVTLACQANELKAKPSVEQLLFGHVFTDHMFQVEWDLDKGWTRPLISKIHNLDLHPGAKVLHYAVEAFEGAKAYRGHDNQIRFFRLDQNIKRLLRSSRRLALPDFDERELMKCIHKLVDLDQDWIPHNTPGQQQLTSLYIRPTIMGIEPSLGVASSRKSLLYVLLSPVGPYFKTGFRPISLYADPGFVRAWPGGAGSAKLGANYAPTIMVQKQAEKLGLQQVLWLYGDDMKLTEVGTMNIFVAVRSPDRESNKVHLITPPLNDGLVLPGITRASILDLARQWPDVVCEERYVTIGELRQLIHEQRLVEMFGAGTACIVCPVNGIQMKDGTRLRIPYTDVTNSQDQDQNQETGAFLTKRILKTITDIQYGRIQHPWAQKLNPY